MKKSIFAFLGILCLAGTASAQQGWVPLTSGVTSTLGCISLVGKDTVYVAGIGNPPLIRSTDGGASWQQPRYPLNVGDGGFVQFFDANYGFLCGTAYKVFRTTNGGQTWDSSSTGLFGGLGIGNGRGGLVAFGSRKNGCVMSGSNIVFTSDSGHTWHPASGEAGGGWYCLAFGDSVHVYAMGPRGPWQNLPGAAGFELSSDGGATWTQMYPQLNNSQGGIPDEVDGITSISGDTLIAVGLEISRSTNSGTTWDTVAYPGNDDKKDIYGGVAFSDSRNGWAVSFGGKILHSTDGGNTWSLQNSGVTSPLLAVYAVDSLLGYVVGNSGIILKTSNGGVSWVKLSSGISSLIQDRIYPQPAGERTFLSYTLPEPQHVSITIDNVTGAKMRDILTNIFQTQGSQAVSIDTSQLPSGTYTYVLQSEKYHATGNIEVIH